MEKVTKSEIKLALAWVGGKKTIDQLKENWGYSNSSSIYRKIAHILAEHINYERESAS